MIWARALFLTAALSMPLSFAAAQAPWPGDAPATTAAPAPASSAASPWGDAPAAPAPASPNAFTAPQGAIPGGVTPWDGGGGGRPQRDCGKEFIPLREDAEKRAGAIKTASEKKSQPALCAAFKSFAEAEAKMLKFVIDHGKECGIPADAEKNLRTAHNKTLEIRKQVCNPQAAPAAARKPSLSDALGTSRLPDTSASGSGGGTFNTLTGGATKR